MDLHIIEFFDQLVRQFIRKARRKQKIEDVLFSALHFVTRIVVFKLETGKLCVLNKGVRKGEVKSQRFGYFLSKL